MDRRLPVPLTLQDVANNPSSFIEERARNHLKKLTRVGPRPAGIGFWTRFRPIHNLEPLVSY